MEKETMLKAALFGVFMLLHPIGLTYSQDNPVPPRLCYTQFALANHACSKVPYTPAVPEPSPPDANNTSPPPPAPATPPVAPPVAPPATPPVAPPATPPVAPPTGPPVAPPTGPPVAPPAGPPVAPPAGPPVAPPAGPPMAPPAVPPTPAPTAPPTAPPINAIHHGHRNRHGHIRHGVDQSNREREGNEEECCRWLQDIDTDCVCQVLVRLPAFLSRPAHEYTVTVGEQCEVTYNCPSAVKYW